MNLNELYKAGIAGTLEQMDLVDMKVHSTPDGEITAIELKFAPKRDTAVISDLAGKMCKVREPLPVPVGPWMAPAAPLDARGKQEGATW